MTKDTRQSSGNGLDLEDDASFGGFFSSLENDKPYLKLGLEGFAGSGKTFTGAQIVIGLWHRLKQDLGRDPKIALFDTETAGKFLIPLFRKAGIPTGSLLHKKSRSIVDLQKTMQLMREGAADILMIDQISHVWSNFVQAYLREKNKAKLSLPDWGVLKPLWNDRFATPLVMDPYHIVLIGRATFEYDTEIVEDGEDTTRSMFKSGVKMQGAGELAFETDIFVLMDRKERLIEKRKTKEVWREATVLKDRANLIDGKTFRNPTYEHFKPSVEFCLGEAVKRPTQVQGDDGILFKNEDDRRDWLKRRDIALEELEGLLVETWPSQTADAKQKKMETLAAVFGTRSWTAISMKRPEEVEAGVAKVKEYIASFLAKEKIAAEEAKAEGKNGKARKTKGEPEATSAPPAGEVTTPAA